MDRQAWWCTGREMKVKRKVQGREHEEEKIRAIPVVMSLCGLGSPQTLTQAQMLLPTRSIKNSKQ